MFKRILLLLSIILLTQTQAQNLPLVGSYLNLQDLNSADFVKVIAYIRSQYTTVADWPIVSVKRQLVNGFNYIIDLKSAAGETGHFTVYSTFQGDITIKTALLNVNSTIFNGTVSSTATAPSATATVPQQVAVANVSVQSIKNTPDATTTHDNIAGGYSQVSDFSSESYKTALVNLYVDHPEVKDYRLVKTQGQVVSGMNYRFTFAKLDNTQVSFVEYVPLGSAATQAPIIDAIVSVFGGWYKVTDPVDYDKALKAILKAYPAYTNYTVADVQKQTVSGYNYLITLKNGDFSQGLFKVYIDLQDNVSVFAQKLYQAKNYAPATIDYYVKESGVRKATLIDANLVQASNIWPGDGLKLKFWKYDGTILGNAFIYNLRGQQQFLIFDS